MTRFFLICLGSALVVAACGGGVETSPGSGSPSGNGAPAGNADCSATAGYCDLRCSGKETPLYPAQCALPACPCLVGITPRSDWAGTYTLPGKVDAVNLVLEADGTFRWTIDGCDFGGGDCGTWKRSQPHTITLLPASGASEFQWDGDVGVSKVSSMNVVGEPGGDLVMQIASPGNKPSAQRWTKGRTCAVCGGGSGPTGQKACTEPVERRCR